MIICLPPVAVGNGSKWSIVTLIKYLSIKTDTVKLSDWVFVLTLILQSIRRMRTGAHNTLFLYVDYQSIMDQTYLMICYHKTGMTVDTRNCEHLFHMWLHTFLPSVRHLHRLLLFINFNVQKLRNGPNVKQLVYIFIQFVG